MFDRRIRVKLNQPLYPNAIYAIYAITQAGRSGRLQGGQALDSQAGLYMCI